MWMTLIVIGNFFLIFLLKEFQILTQHVSVEHLNHLLYYDCNVTRHKVSLDCIAIPSSP